MKGISEVRILVVFVLAMITISALIMALQGVTSDAESSIKKSFQNIELTSYEVEEVRNESWESYSLELGSSSQL